jgi:hypothetical protein
LLFGWTGYMQNKIQEKQFYRWTVFKTNKMQVLKTPIKSTTIIKVYPNS